MNSKNYITQKSIIDKGASAFSRNLDGFYVRQDANDSIQKDLSLADINTANPTFNITGRDGHKTRIGFFCTILAYLMISITFAYEIYLFNQSPYNPNVSFHEEYSHSTIEFNSAPNAFFWRTSFYVGDDLIKNTDVLKFIRQRTTIHTLTQVDGTTTKWTHETSNVTPAIQQCDSVISNMTNTTEIEGWLETTGTKDDNDWGLYILCSDASQGFLTNGTQTDNIRTYFSFDIYPCDISTAADCNWPSNMGKYDHLKFNLEISTAYIHPGNWTHPIHYTMHTVIKGSIDYYLMKTYDIYFKQINLYSDHNQFFSTLWDQLKHSIQTFDYMITDIKRRVSLYEITEPLIDVNFRAGLKIEDVTREYIKFIDMIGEMGGLMEIILVTFGLTYAWYNAISFEQEMLNKSVLYQQEHHNKKDSKRMYFSFDYLFWMSLKSSYCCYCKKKKFDKKETKLRQAREKLEKDMDIIQINHTKERSEIIERILIKPYQMKLIPMALRIQLENDQNREEQKNLKQDASNITDSNEKDTDNEEMSQIQAADMLVQRMGHCADLDFVEKSLNLWLINILDMDLQKKRYNGYTSQQEDMKFNPNDLGYQNRIDIVNFLKKNDIDYQEDNIEQLYKVQGLMAQDQKITKGNDSWINNDLNNLSRRNQDPKLESEGDKVVVKESFGIEMQKLPGDNAFDMLNDSIPAEDEGGDLKANKAIISMLVHKFNTINTSGHESENNVINRK